MLEEAYAATLLESEAQSARALLRYRQMTTQRAQQATREKEGLNLKTAVQDGEAGPIGR